MFQEKELLKAATYYSSTHDKYKNNFVTNRTFADSAINLKRDFGASKETMLKLMTESHDTERLLANSQLSDFTKSYNIDKALNSTLHKTSSRQHSRSNWHDLQKGKYSMAVSRRPFSEISRPSHGANKLSFINNFDKAYRADVNEIFNMRINTSAIKQRTNKKLVDIELGEPNQVIPKFQIPSKILIKSYSKNKKSAQDGAKLQTFLNAIQ